MPLLCVYIHILCYTHPLNYTLNKHTEENCKCNYGLFDPTGRINSYHGLNVAWWKQHNANGKLFTSIFCNPPYNNLQDWIVQGYEASLHGCTVVFLLPTTKCDQTTRLYFVCGQVPLNVISQLVMTCDSAAATVVARK